jgi:putative ABC transport system permease protein
MPSPGAWDWFRVAAARVLGSFSRRKREEDLENEIRAHLDALVDENIRRGMTPEEARYAARREFGGVEQTREAYRELRGLPFLDMLGQDLRFAARSLTRRRGFAAAAILILALGIGATTAVFSVVDRILFRSLPYPHDEQLVSFGVKAPFEGIEFMLAPEYAVLRAQSGPFETMTSLMPGGADCDITEQNPVRLNCALVESTFLSTLGIAPILGRDFVRDDDRATAPRVALLSYGLWRARFGGDPQVGGRTISLDGKPVSIVGVLPASFEMPNLGSADMLMPQALDDSALDRNNPRVLLRAFARLKPGVGIAQATAALQPWFQDSLRFVPPQFRAEVSLRVRSLRDRQIEDSRLGAWVLLGAVVGVLLLACSNVANLLLVRAAGRQRELAVRAAFGACRGRLARQMLSESLLLGAIGGLVGILTAFLLLRVFVTIAPEGIARLPQASIDARVLVFNIGISLLCGILFGLVPAVGRPSPESLTGRNASTVSHGFFRQGLVAAQIAGSIVLLAGAGLLLRTLSRIESVPLGLETLHVIAARILLAEHRYPDTPRQLAFFQNLEDRLGRIPGISVLAFTDTLPPSGGTQATFFASIEIPGRARLAQGTGGMVGWRTVTPSYFDALGIPIVSGRKFTEEDRAPAENPVVLSATLAKKLFPNENPLGKSLRFSAFDRQGPWRTVVGVAGDVKNNGLIASADPEFYIPWKNDPETYLGRSYAIFRTPASAASIAPWVRAEIERLDPTVPVEFSTMDQRVSKLTQRPRFDALLLSLFAGIAVLLAVLGMYGVVSFFVLQRTKEIGVRMALGANPRGILMMVLAKVARWTAGGAALGLLGAWFCTRLLQSLLFQVQAHDPWLLGVALLVLCVAAFLAAWIPARRAMRVDPMVALGYE